MTKESLKCGNAPSAKRIAEYCRIDITEARIARRLMKGELDPLQVLGEDFYRSYYSTPKFHQQVMDALDKVTHCHGVEYLRTNRGEYEYLNTGETYDTTVVRCLSRRTWMLTTWGDLVEREGTKETE